MCSFRNDDLVTALHNSNQVFTYSRTKFLSCSNETTSWDVFTDKISPWGSFISCCGAFVLELCGRYSNFLFFLFFEALWGLHVYVGLKLIGILLLFLKTLFPSCNIQGQKSTFNFNIVKNFKSYFVKGFVGFVL